MIHWEDKLYSHKYYGSGAIGLLRCYLGIHELKAKASKTEEEEKKLVGIEVTVSI